MKTSRKTSYRTRKLAVWACVAVFCGLSASAQTFPDKPIKIIVGAPAGGSADVIARTLSTSMSQILGQPVIVENKPGASGLLGTQELLKAQRDGHTLMIAVNGIVSEIPHMMKTPFDPFMELRPLAELATTGLLMVSSPHLPVNDVTGAAAYIIANPDKISYASYSSGSMSHTLGLEFNKLMNTDMVHVGYRGSPPALVDVMGGNVSFMFDGPATSIPLIKGGKLKALATTAPHRLAALADVPTFAELGYKSLTEIIWMGLWTTPDVPAANQAKVRDTVLKALQQPKVREQFAALGLTIGSGASPEELSRSLRAAYDKQAARLKAINFRPE